jgi:hypothetical protein
MDGRLNWSQRNNNYTNRSHHTQSRHPAPVPTLVLHAFAHPHTDRDSPLHLPQGHSTLNAWHRTTPAISAEGVVLMEAISNPQKSVVDV